MGRPVPWSREDMVHVVGHPGTQQDDMGNGTDPEGPSHLCGTPNRI